MGITKDSRGVSLSLSSTLVLDEIKYLISYIVRASLLHKYIGHVQRAQLQTLVCERKILNF